MMVHIRNLTLVCCLVLVSACVNFTTVRSAPGHQQVISQSKVVALLPVEAEISTADIAGNKHRMHDYEYTIQQMTRQELERSFKSKGYQVNVETKRSIHDKKLSRELVTLRQNYNKAALRMFDTIRKKEEIAINTNEQLGKKAVEFASALSADMLIFTDYISIVKTSGARTRDFMIDMLVNTGASNNADNTRLVVTLVDGKTGNVIWANIAFDIRGLFESGFDSMSDAQGVDERRIAGLSQKLLKKFPR